MNKKNPVSRFNAILTLVMCCAVLLIVCGLIGNAYQTRDSVAASAPVTLTDAGERTTAPATNSTVATTTTTTTTVATTLPAVDPIPAGNEPGERHECSGNLSITSDAANVRSNAGGDYPLVTTVKKGESYRVVSQRDSGTGILWYEIALNEGTGYIAGSYVSYDGGIIDGKAYLTFDDGPSSNTSKILDILDRYGAKATFFVVYHKGCDDIYRDIVERGHTLALHSYTHDYSQIYKNETAYFDDIGKLSDYLYELTGERSTIIRFPGGSSNTVSAKHCKGVMTKLTAEAGRRGFRYYDWDVDSGDAQKNKVPKDTIVRNVKNNIGNRRQPVILMHDAQVKTTTVDALPEIIEFLQNKGFSLERITMDTRESHQRINN